MYERYDKNYSSKYELSMVYCKSCGRTVGQYDTSVPLDDEWYGLKRYKLMDCPYCSTPECGTPFPPQEEGDSDSSDEDTD